MELYLTVRVVDQGQALRHSLSRCRASYWCLIQWVLGDYNRIYPSV